MFARTLRLLTFCTLVAACLPCLLVAAEEKSKTYDDPEKASKDVDFQIQGEYRGSVTDRDKKEEIGAHVIALGGGKFRGVAYHGGLPGEGWKKDAGAPPRFDTELKDGTVTFIGERHIGVLKDGVITLTTKDTGAVCGSLKKVTRESPTLGAKPPAGAVVLFDGKTNDFKEGDKRVTKDGLLMQGVTSKTTFGDYSLHVEFRLPFEPYARDQGRGNSGIYMQGRYETQMLDSFGLDGKHNECGGIYSVKDPDVNMCYPPLSWQTYDIDFTAARFDAAGKKTANAKMTVKHNGVVIHKDVEVPKATTAAPLGEGPQDGPIYLQDHGNAVRYRNIWVAPKGK